MTTLNDYIKTKNPLFDDRREDGIHDCNGECLKNWKKI